MSWFKDLIFGRAVKPERVAKAWRYYNRCGMGHIGDWDSNVCPQCGEISDNKIVARRIVDVYTTELGDWEEFIMWETK